MATTDTIITDNPFKKPLANHAMKSEWEQVIQIYQRDQSVHKAKITKSGGTALHIAVSDSQIEVVVKLVEIISKAAEANESKFEALKTGDDQGNTPLHIAATLGIVPMCECIAKVDYSLIAARNNDGETPIFLAALHGHKVAFLCLHHYLGEEKNIFHCRRNDGDTVLHCAITGYHFDLAFQIIRRYKNQLVNAVNQQGLSPLHLLATKPSAFKSGSLLGHFSRIIYHCVLVDKVQWETYHPKQDSDLAAMGNLYPQNYQTCCYIFTPLRKALKVVATYGGSTEEQKQTRDAENPAEKQSSTGAGSDHLFPPNFGSIFEFLKLVSKAMLIILGLGSTGIQKIRDKKKQHTWSVQILDELLQLATYEYDNDGTKPGPSQTENIAHFFDQPPETDSGSEDATQKEKKSESNSESGNKGDNKEEVRKTPGRESPLLIAAKNGITEIVKKILEKFPVAIHDRNSEKKNVVLLAVEYRQPHVYQLLLKITTMKDSVFRKIDNKGNSALHLAATLGDHKPWLIPGAALQMQWELKWYEFVKESMPFHFFVRYNNENMTPKDILTKTHKDLVKAGGEWLTSTSESCSVVAALIATVAFATSATVPGGVKQESGMPTLEDEPAFNVFAISSLVALCFSVTAVVMFLSILTSRYQERDFAKDLPNKLLVGLTSLFVSIASMLISFCAGHFFVLKDKLKYAAFPVYAVTCLPVTFFAIAQFPLYFDLMFATFTKLPQRSYKALAL